MMKQKVNWPKHLLYPGDVRSHLDKDILLNLSLELYRAREIKRGDVMETFTDARGNSVQKIAFTNHKYEMYGYLVNEHMFIDTVFWNQAFDSYFVTTPMKPGSKVYARSEGTNEMVSANPAVFIFLDEHECDEAIYVDNDTSYYLVDGWEQYGDITNRGEFLAHTYRFVWDEKLQHYVGLDWKGVSKQIRRPWMTKIIQDLVGYDAANIADAFKLIAFILQKLNSQLTPLEQEMLAPYIQSNIGNDALERLGERRRVLNELLESYAGDKILRTGADLRDDLIFNHPLIKY